MPLPPRKKSVFVGGRFDTINDQKAPRLAEITSEGKIVDFVYSYIETDVVNALVVANDRLFCWRGFRIHSAKR